MKMTYVKIFKSKEECKRFFMYSIITMLLAAIGLKYFGKGSGIVILLFFCVMFGIFDWIFYTDGVEKLMEGIRNGKNKN